MGRQRNVLTPERSALHLWGAELRARRDLSGLSLNGLSLLVHYDAGYLGRLERGEQFASRKVAEACDEGLGCGGELVRLWHLADDERQREARGTASPAGYGTGLVAVPYGRPGGLVTVSAVQRSASAYAEGFGDSVAAVGQLVQADLERAPAGAGQLADPDLWRELTVRWFTDPDDEAGEPGSLLACGLTAGIGMVRAATELFSGYDYQFGGGRSRLLIAQVLEADVLPTLAQLTPGPSAVSEYLGEVGAMLRLAAWTAYDVGRHGLAQGYFAQALRLAKAAGDRCLGGRIFAGMSHQANFLGHYQRAVELARAAREGFRGQGTPTAMALAWAMEARAQASLRRERECLHAMAQAEQWLARTDPANEPPWLRYFDQAELHAEFAHCYRDLGHPGKACLHAERSIQSSASLYVRSLSFCRTVQAAGYLMDGELEQATALAAAVVDTAADQVRSHRLRAYLDDFRVRLALHPAGRAARDFEEYMAERLGRAGSPPG